MKNEDKREISVKLWEPKTILSGDPLSFSPRAIYDMIEYSGPGSPKEG